MAEQSVIHKLTLGTVQFGLHYGITNVQGKTPAKEVETILKVAQQASITTIDTAWGYGSSEEVLGSILNRKNEFQVISKFPIVNSEKPVMYYARQSLERLHIKNFYGYLAHTADVLKKSPLVWDELKKLKDQGLALKIGYSLYSPEELQYLLNLNMIPDLIQIPYNIWDRRFEPYFEMLMNNGVEIHTRSAFLQGLFFANAEDLPLFFESVKPELIQIRSKFSSVEEMSGYLLYFCASHPAVSRVVVGVNTAQQLLQNVNSLKNVKHIEWPNFAPKTESILLPYHWPKTT